MTEKVAVLTAIYDNYDVLRKVLPQNGNLDIEWICVTDSLDVVNEPQGWTVVYNPRPGVHPNLAAKHPKMLPMNYTEAPRSIWMDASYEIVNPDFVQEALSFADPIAQFNHPWRQCSYEEGNVSTQLTYKYGGHRFWTQMHEYREAGHPDQWGLWETGLIARQHTDEIKAFGEAWLAECEKWSFQDQVSQAPVLRVHGLRPTYFPGDRTDNTWLAYRASGRH